jgi:hypothetical protein
LQFYVILRGRISKWRWPDTDYSARVNQLHLCRMDGVWTENIFHCTPDLWLTTVISYVSTIQTESTSVIAPSASPIYLTVLTLHFYFIMIVTHKYIPYIPTSDTYPLKHVPFKFFLRVFPIAPHFNLTCLAQSPPLHTYIGEPKAEALHLSIEFSILGYLHSFNFFLWWANQIGSLRKKTKKVGLVRHLQLINMKQNKFPQTIMGVLAQVTNGGKHFWK